MKQTPSRRSFLQALIGAPLVAATAVPAFASQDAVIGRLIERARAASDQLSGRMDHISRALLGVRYKSNTLIGGMRRPEVFVVREDAFDCVTFCEFVLAAAMARDVPEFKNFLRRIRYHQGVVSWDQRNHYFAEWCRRNIDNQLCRPVLMEPAVTIEKSLNSMPGLGTRRVSFAAIPRATLLANQHLLSSGDVVGFTSRRWNLDYFHTGLIAFGKNRELILRHASRSRGRILDEPIDAFLAANGVKYVTLLRPAEASLQA
jgi:hypothetical protein